MIFITRADGGHRCWQIGDNKQVFFEKPVAKLVADNVEHLEIAAGTKNLRMRAGTRTTWTNPADIIFILDNIDDIFPER